MGLATSLNAINLTAAEKSSAAVSTVDLQGLLSSLQQQVGDLTKTLVEIQSKLPSGDPNIAAITSILSSLS